MTMTSGKKGGKPRRSSRYAVQLKEKQNLKNIFGIRERQLRRYYRSARAARAETGPRLVVMLERRLDNTLYRAGFAETRAQGRQMASHGLFTINGRRVNIPSHEIKVGDVVGVKESKQKKALFANWIRRAQNIHPPTWIVLTPEQYNLRVTGDPSYEEANLGVDIQAVVEFLSRS